MSAMTEPVNKPRSIGGLKTLRPGDIMETTIHEKYIYLGYYTGRLWSIYKRPEAGYLYIFLNPSWSNAEYNAATVTTELLHRIRVSFDGNGCYTTAPKKFERLITHIDLEPIEDKIQTVFGYLQRTGDRKPLKKKG